MSTAETVDIDTKYKTVGELLEATATSSELLGSSGSDCYAFTEPCLDSFALKINRDITQLDSTTILTSMPQLLIGTNLGQPLFSSADGKISILLKQSGNNLYDFGIENAQRRSELLSKILAAAASTDDNPFIPIMQTCAQSHTPPAEPGVCRGTARSG
jgi:hypothetical protein